MRVTLNSKRRALNEKPNFPVWFGVLCRNCRQARENLEYQNHFEKLQRREHSSIRDTTTRFPCATTRFNRNGREPVARGVKTRQHARMKVNHLHLMVPDVRASAEFFQKYFDLRNSSGNAGLTVLLDDDGFVLTLMKAGSRTTKGYPENFHVGFFVADEGRVDEIHRRMKADGLEVAPPARSHAYSFYVGAPGGFLVEVGA